MEIKNFNLRLFLIKSFVKLLCYVKKYEVIIQDHVLYGNLTLEELLLFVAIYNMHA